MAKREPKPIAPCPHDIAQWRGSGTKQTPAHTMYCCRCQDELAHERGTVPRHLGIVLFRDVQDGGYAPFQPKWNR